MGSVIRFAFRHLHPDASEYSWVGRTGDGYRYDHAFCSAGLTAAISTCECLHEPRHDRPSDHSALTAGFTLQPPSGLAVTSPITAAAPATLF